MTNKLIGSTLKIRRTQDIDIDIIALTNAFEWAMADLLYDKLTENLDLDPDTADYIDQTEGLADTILDLVKVEMFNRAAGMKTRA
jgi:hypothetical protein